MCEQNPAQSQDMNLRLLEASPVVPESFSLWTKQYFIIKVIEKYSHLE